VLGAGYRRLEDDSVPDERGFLFYDAGSWLAGDEFYTPVFVGDEFGAMLVWDDAADQLVSFGSQIESRATLFTLPFTGAADIGGAWQQPIDPTVEYSPGSAYGSLVYDERIAAPILFSAGTSEATFDGSTDELIVFDHDEWVPVPLADLEGDGNLPPLGSQGVGYSRALGRTILYGGGFGQAASSRTHAVDATPDEHPAIVFGIDPAFAALGDGAPRTLHLRFVAGASGAGVDGYDVAVWTGDRYEVVGTSAAGVDARTELLVDVEPTVVARSLVAGRVFVQVAARGTNGSHRARIQVDEAETTLGLALE
jgi:hypothetical protein